MCLDEQLGEGRGFCAFVFGKRSSFLLHTHRAKASNPFLLKPYVPPRLKPLLNLSDTPLDFNTVPKPSGSFTSAFVSVSKWKQTRSGHNDGLSLLLECLSVPSRFHLHVHRFHKEYEASKCFRDFFSENQIS